MSLVRAGAVQRCVGDVRHHEVEHRLRHGGAVVAHGNGDKRQHVLVQAPSTVYPIRAWFSGLMGFIVPMSFSGSRVVN